MTYDVKSLYCPYCLIFVVGDVLRTSDIKELWISMVIFRLVFDDPASSQYRNLLQRYFSFCMKILILITYASKFIDYFNFITSTTIVLVVKLVLSEYKSSLTMLCSEYPHLPCVFCSYLQLVQSDSQ